MPTTLAASLRSAAPLYVWIWAITATCTADDYFEDSSENREKKPFAARAIQRIPGALCMTAGILLVHATAWWANWL